MVALFSFISFRIPVHPGHRAWNPSNVVLRRMLGLSLVAVGVIVVASCGCCYAGSSNFRLSNLFKRWFFSTLRLLKNTFRHGNTYAYYRIVVAKYRYIHKMIGHRPGYIDWNYPKDKIEGRSHDRFHVSYHFVCIWNKAGHSFTDARPTLHLLCIKHER